MARTRWHYQGDINLEHGGSFIDLSEMKHGYATVIEITGLDSACGFNGAILIEERTVITDHREYWDAALNCIGAGLTLDGDDINDNGRIYRNGSLAWKLCLIYALSSYGHYDTERSVVVQPRRDCPTEYDGWTAARIRSNGLCAYVRREFLGLAR
jgi:hypothetical protein